MGQKSTSLSNFDNMLTNSLGGGINQDDIQQRYQKLKKYSTDIEKQKKALEEQIKYLEEQKKYHEDTNKKTENEIYQHKKIIFEQTTEIQNLKLKLANEKQSTKELPRISSKNIRKVLNIERPVIQPIKEEKETEKETDKVLELESIKLSENSPMIENSEERCKEIVIKEDREVIELKMSERCEKEKIIEDKVKSVVINEINIIEDEESDQSKERMQSKPIINQPSPSYSI